LPDFLDASIGKILKVLVSFHAFALVCYDLRPLKLALNFSPPHIRALDLKTELKCSKVFFRALKVRGEDPNRPLIYTDC
jgi:hypothetical protein